jgi:hypothetical protein
MQMPVLEADAGSTGGRWRMQRAADPRRCHFFLQLTYHVMAEGVVGELGHRNMSFPVTFSLGNASACGPADFPNLEGRFLARLDARMSGGAYRVMEFPPEQLAGREYAMTTRRR